MRSVPVILLMVLLPLLAQGCRVEWVGRGAAAACAEGDEPSGDLWVYTSMYPTVVERLEALAGQRLPGVRVHWYRGGSEKVANRLEAEFASGGAQADVLAVSDPFLFERLRGEGLFARYVSPEGLRIPPSLIDLDGHYAAMRVSSMVLAFREELAEEAPRTFAELAEPKWRGRVVVGDPLLSGTAFTWTVFLERSAGRDYLDALARNEAVVAGGNAAVQQKLESGEADVGVLLLENVLFAREKGSRLSFRYPEDGAVTIPGHVALFRGSQNPVAARAFVDLLLSPEGQALMVDPGQMHAADPRQPGPSGEGGLDDLLSRAQPWDADILQRGTASGGVVKAAFAKAFGR